MADEESPAVPVRRRGRPGEKRQIRSGASETYLGDPLQGPVTIVYGAEPGRALGASDLPPRPDQRGDASGDRTRDQPGGVRYRSYGQRWMAGDEAAE